MSGAPPAGHFENSVYWGRYRDDQDIGGIRGPYGIKSSALSTRQQWEITGSIVKTFMQKSV